MANPKPGLLYDDEGNAFERKRPPGTRLRNFRADDELWDAAKATAARRGEDLSSVIRKGLERYVARHRE